MVVAIYSGIIPNPTFIERLINGLAEKNVKVYLFGKLENNVSYKNKNIRVVGHKSRLDRLFNALIAFLKLFLFKFRDLHKYYRLRKTFGFRYWLKELPVLWHKPDIFHVQWAKSVIDWMWLQQFGVKIVLSLRGAHINYSPITIPGLADDYKKCFPKIDAFHAVSQAILTEGLKYGINASKTKVIYSGLNLAEIPFIEKRFEKTSVIKLLSVGRSHWIKGYLYSIEACEILSKLNVDFIYEIIGGINEENLFIIHNSGLEQKIKLLPALPFDQIVEKYKNADLFLLPSVEEGIANVVLEAMAIGLPVVSTRCGGMEEVIQHGINGWLVDVRSRKQIADAILGFLELSPNEKQQMAHNARKTIEQKFSQERMVKEMIELYKSVC